MSAHVRRTGEPVNEPTFWETARLSIGAFLTSPGVGILGVLGAAWLTLVGVGKRLDGEKELAAKARKAERKKEREADARERWQWFYARLWDNREDLPLDALLDGIRSLRELSTTRQQSAMLEVLVRYVQSEAEEEL